MRLDELIKKLQDLRDKWGDCYVRVDSYIYYTDIHHIDDVVFDHDRDRVNIILDK